MTTQVLPVFSIRPFFAFIQAQLIGQARNWRTSAPTLFAPMMLLIVFTVAGDGDGASLVPFVVGFTVMFSGQTLAQILITWRNNHIFTRLSATPIPTSHLIVGTVLTQLLLFLLQALLVMVAGLLLNDLTLDIGRLIIIIGVLLLGTTTFLSFGALVAAFVNKTETAGIAYTFTLVPMIFFGGSLFKIPALGDFGRFLPTNLLTELLNPHFGFGEPNAVVLSVSLLLGYSATLTLAAIRFFDTEV